MVDFCKSWSLWWSFFSTHITEFLRLPTTCYSTLLYITPGRVESRGRCILNLDVSAARGQARSLPSPHSVVCFRTRVFGPGACKRRFKRYIMHVSRVQSVQDVTTRIVNMQFTQAGKKKGAFPKRPDRQMMVCVWCGGVEYQSHVRSRPAGPIRINHAL